VPAQLIGQRIKSDLYIAPPGGNMIIVNARSMNDLTYIHADGYTKQQGLTTTGIKDAFGSWWYFGFLKFGIVGFIMGKLYKTSMRKDFNAQLLYILLIGDGMHIITHNTHWFFQDWPHMALFLLPGLIYARTRHKP